MSTNAEVPRAWATEPVDLVDADPMACPWRALAETAIGVQVRWVSV